MTRISGDWLTHPATQQVLKMLEDAGHDAYFVGGCVRNSLLGAPVDDIDISTSAKPEAVMTLARATGLKAVPTGIDHGTVTVIAKGIPHEITTYRADVETDGRHAVVRFSDDIHEDAIRRDFTMNALYADRNGQILDPLGGLPDLRARRIRFIRNADQRIREDYLRILRFFRFTAWYADPASGFDPDALDAIARNLDGLPGLSRERVGHEIVKLLQASDPVVSVAVMQQTGVLQTLLPGTDPRALGPLVHIEGTVGLGPLAMRRLAAIGGFDGAGLRLSRARRRYLETCQALTGTTESAAELGYRHKKELAVDILLLRSAMLEAPFRKSDIAGAERGANARFPVSACDLMPNFQGPALGEKLKELETLWIASGFSKDKTALLATL